MGQTAPGEIGHARYEERRDAVRSEVFFRTRIGGEDGGSSPARIVDVSASGFMARTDAAFAPGDIVTMKLPVVGYVQADVRWALGGRIGCRFTRTIALPKYLELLGALAGSAS